MFITKLVNRLLAPLNIAVTRRSNLETLKRASCDLAYARQSIETDRLLSEIRQQLLMVPEIHQQISMVPEIHQKISMMPELCQNTKELLEKQQHMQSEIDLLGRQLEKTKASLLEESMFERWNLLDRLEEMSPYPRRETCPLCGASLPEHLTVYETECIFGGGRLLRHQCPECDVIFGPEKIFHLSDKTLATEYRWHYTFTNETDCTHLEKRAFYEMEPKREGVYLNYGAGRWAKSIPELREEGWDVYGYEPFAGGDADHIIRSPEELATMQFDGIFSHDLLEHLKYPVKELALMRTFLKPSGCMNHATASFEYMYEYSRFHLFFFLGRSREVLAQKAGFQIKQFISDGIYKSCLYTLPEQDKSVLAHVSSGTQTVSEDTESL